MKTKNTKAKKPGKAAKPAVKPKGKAPTKQGAVCGVCLYSVGVAEYVRNSFETLLVGRPALHVYEQLDECEKLTAMGLLEIGTYEETDGESLTRQKAAQRVFDWAESLSSETLATANRKAFMSRLATPHKDSSDPFPCVFVSDVKQYGWEKFVAEEPGLVLIEGRTPRDARYYAPAAYKEMLAYQQEQEEYFRELAEEQAELEKQAALGRSVLQLTGAGSFQDKKQIDLDEDPYTHDEDNKKAVLNILAAIREYNKQGAARAFSKEALGAFDSLLYFYVLGECKTDPTGETKTAFEKTRASWAPLYEDICKRYPSVVGEVYDAREAQREFFAVWDELLDGFKYEDYAKQNPGMSQRAKVLLAKYTTAALALHRAFSCEALKRLAPLDAERLRAKPLTSKLCDKAKPTGKGKCTRVFVTKPKDKNGKTRKGYEFQFGKFQGKIYTESQRTIDVLESAIEQFLKRRQGKAEDEGYVKLPEGLSTRDARTKILSGKAGETLKGFFEVKTRYKQGYIRLTIPEEYL